MDILLILYSIILAGILAAPFLYIRLNEDKITSWDGEIKLSIYSERKMLLENLKDLKSEMDTGKIQVSEFTELSKDIISKLKEIDNKIQSVQAATISSPPLGTCNKCNFYTPVANAKFCAMCGNSLV